MNRTAVKSSQIREIGYDATTQTLEIQFIDRKTGNGGGVYRYAGVGPQLHAEMLRLSATGGSVGTYFGQFVKHLPTTKLEGTEFVPLKVARASGSSLDLIRRLAKEAGFWNRDPADCVDLLWRDVIQAAGIVFSERHGRKIETMLGTLLQPQASAMIEWLKGRAA